MWGNRYVQYEVAHAVNNCSGGLILMWNLEVFQMRNSIKGMRWIIIIGKLIPGEWEYAIGVIYGGLIVGDQIQVYQEINNAKETFSCPLLLFGDFNHIVNVSERRNQQYDSIEMRTFRDWINLSSFIDLQLEGSKYTWSRGNSRGRIDRCLVEAQWIERFPSIALKGVENIISDHVALSVQLNESQRWGPKPFRCLNTWFTHPTFKHIISTEWRNMGQWPINRKLRLLKEPIKRWNGEVFSNIETKLKTAEPQLFQLDRDGGSRDLNQSELDRKKELLIRCSKWRARQC